MGLINGRATAEGTKKRSDKFEALIYKELGNTGLTVSAAGFGSYRIDYRVQEHYDALRYALENGVNLIDSSANYSDGGSELLIGKVLSDLVNEKLLEREEIIIVTKGGYLQGKNLESARSKKETGVGYSDVVEYTENLWHCIHPDFLKDQIELSRQRLQVETIDFYLLHNPEYFLDSPNLKELTTEEIRHEYYNRIRYAFEYLELEAENGRIGFYGISSNTFPNERDDQTFTSLERCFEIASSIKHNNNFKVIQLPANLMERGLVTNKNQESGTQNVLDFASTNGIGVLINRPLNAIKGKLTRLANFKVNDELIKLDESQIESEISVIEVLEDEFLREHIGALKLDEKIDEGVKSFMKTGQLLKQNWKNFGSIENFNDVKKQFLIPRANYAFSVIIRSPHVTEEMKDKLDKIAKQINRIISIIESIYGLQANIEHKSIENELDPFFEDYEDFRDKPLSQKAIMIISSMEGVSCVLVGMRLKQYVDDVLEAITGRVENSKMIMEELKI